MAILTQIEKGAFLNLFIRDGYVLNFSTNSFDIFTLESVGVQLCSHYGLSKGKSLTKYIIEDASEKEAVKLLKDLLDYYTENYKKEYDKSTENGMFGYSEYDEKFAVLYNKCQAYMQKALCITAPMIINAEQLQSGFSSDYLSKQIELMLKMQVENPTEAIGKAKELIESCCKTILDKREVRYENGWSLSKLTGETLSVLQLTPQQVPGVEPASEYIKSLLGNLRGITSSLAKIRNSYGSGHGRSSSYIGLETRHAKLAVGCSVAFVTFIWDTFKEELSCDF